MNEAKYNELRATSWRRTLTPAEEAELQAYLAVHPEEKASAEEDAALTQLLTDLPDAPVPSNFTSQVMQELERETMERHRPRPASWWQRWTPRMGWAGMVLGMAFLAVQLHHRAEVKEAELREGVATLVKTLPPAPEVVLTDFDVIQEMPVVEVDEELWLALSQ